MGSEHYCLRWNNHQSNLLGVFSQLLESESLVDVTLACTEGPSIRAHKVVLSACSSYFQALFLDHPNRHPIVILKDVRFTELRTLVDFMYKGEVNVEYCQLSALLRTAESLKVKGLADMTNINAAVASRQDYHHQQQHQQPQQPQQQQQHQQHQQQQQQQQQQQHHQYQHQQQQSLGLESSKDRDKDKDKERDKDNSMTTTTATTTTSLSPNNTTNMKECNEEEHSKQHNVQPQQQQPHVVVTGAAATGSTVTGDEKIEAVDMSDCPPSPMDPGSPCQEPLALDRPRRDSEDAASLEETRGSLSPISVYSGPSDMSLSNNNTGTTPGVLPLNLPQSRLPSPHSTEPLAGPSGLPPVQQVPLSLKKEVDWERSIEERCASSEISTDYRLPPDPVSLALGLEAGGWGALIERAGSHGSSPGPGLLGPSPGFSGLASLARRCGVCLATFPSAWLLERHALLQHAGQPNDDKPFTCEQCGQRYRYRSAYVKHREQNHRARLPADKLFTCDVCGMQFRYLKSFKKHRLNHALERLQRGSTDRTNGGSIGGGGGGGVSSLLSPSIERSDQVSSTGEPSSMLETGSDTNPGDGEEPTREPFFDNPREETITETSNVRENRDDGETVAMDLGTGASGSGNINTVATGGVGGTSESGDVEETNVEQPSEEVGMITSENSEQRVVGLVSGRAHHHHHDPDRRERRFACPFCGKCVRSKENLKLHVRKHTGERPFVCLFCGRAFGGKSDLTRHLRIHTGERPYHCEMCGKCFARADYLSKHLTTHIHHNHQR